MQQEKGILVMDVINFSSNFKMRIISGVILVIIFSLSVLWSEKLFFLLMLGVAVGMLSEWFEMTKKSFIDLTLGMILIVIAIVSLLVARIENSYILYLYFIAIWSMDSFAMIGGKMLKGPKLAPVVSPNKTWSGLLSGLIAVGSITGTISYLIPISNTRNIFTNSINMTLFFVVLGLIAQISDLLVSYFKRKYRVKDTGSIIPGHGGILDRFDSILLTAPILFLKVCFFYVS